MFNFAHAEVEHKNIIESASHSVALDPILLSGLIIGLASAIPLVVYLVSKSVSATIIIVLTELFIIAATMYTVLPVLSVICITAGFALSMLLMFSSLVNEGKGKKT